MLRHMHVQYGSVSTCQDGDVSHTHRVYNARTHTRHTRLPNYRASPKFFRPLIVLHLWIFHHCMFLFSDAKFNPAVDGKPSVVVALVMKHIAFFFFFIDPHSWSFLLFFDHFRVCNLDLFDSPHIAVSHHEWMHLEHTLMCGRPAKDT